MNTRGPCDQQNRTQPEKGRTPSPAAMWGDLQDLGLRGTSQRSHLQDAPRRHIHGGGQWMVGAGAGGREGLVFKGDRASVGKVGSSGRTAVCMPLGPLTWTLNKK